MRDLCAKLLVLHHQDLELLGGKKSRKYVRCEQSWTQSEDMDCISSLTGPLIPSKAPQKLHSVHPAHLDVMDEYLPEPGRQHVLGGLI